MGDSKRAMDEYTSEICMGGHNTVVLHNTCEDSLLAAPIILDLIILAELCERIEVKTGKEVISEYVGLRINTNLRWHGTLYFKVNKPGIQVDSLLCLVKILAHSPFWESQTVHGP